MLRMRSYLPSTVRVHIRDVQFWDHVLQIPLKVLTFKFLSKGLSFRHVSIRSVLELRPHSVKNLFVFIHPDLSQSHVILVNCSFSNLVWLTLSEHVTDLGARENFQRSSAHPDLMIKPEVSIHSQKLRNSRNQVKLYCHSSIIDLH